MAAALLVLTVVVYWQVRSFELVNWDDPSYITDNPNLAAGLTWDSAWWALTTGHSPYWHQRGPSASRAETKTDFSAATPADREVEARAAAASTIAGASRRGIAGMREPPCGGSLRKSQRRTLRRQPG
jgi:hypothetical protein